MKVAIVGATGLVGSVILRVLEERNFPVLQLFPVASSKSVGKTVKFKNEDFEVIDIEQAIKQKCDIAIFSAGSSVSLKYAPIFAEKGTYVIDNSSAWRMSDDIKLIVPEINAGLLTSKDKIIANPNCSTIQLVVALADLHKKYKIKRLIISTYQSVTGTGVKAVQQLENERSGIDSEKAYPFEIDLNCFPHGGDFLENGYTTEEIKLVNETCKIYGDYDIQITATVVRVPVLGGHSESVNVEFENDFEIDDIVTILQNTKGVSVINDNSKNLYPMPKYCQGKDDVFVGRIRRDFSNPKSLNLWIVADNLRKGAATNAVQIGEKLIEYLYT